MRATVALCVFGLLAASLAEDSAQTEPVDDDVGRQREVRDTGDVYTETARRRQKRHSHAPCGLCSVGSDVTVARPCYTYRRVCTKRKTCGRGRLRHRCCVKYRLIPRFPHCCSPGRLSRPSNKRYQVCIRPGGRRHVPEVRTTEGVIRGRVVKAPQGSKVNEYLGIPFARPPVGDLRFHDPVRLDKLPTDPYEATDQKHSCMQWLDTRFGSFEGSAMWNAPNERREDCLYLNVWTPCSRGRKAVMVWIYGGGFGRGSNALWVYDGKALAAHGDVIIVVPNYRVGTFGFLSTGDGRIKGNFGLLDQVMALEWVRDNIAAFGGDPDRVTLFGESAGAASIGFHLMSPCSCPLFRRTILESGSPSASWAFMTSSQARDRSRTFLRRVNCSRDDADAMLRCLRAQPVDVIEREQWVPAGFMSMPWVPTVDGRFLTDTPYNVMKTGRVQRKESIIGVNKNEGTFVVLHFGAILGFTKDGRNPQNQTTFQRGVDFFNSDLSVKTRARLKRLYRPRNDNDLAFRDAFGDVAGDRGITCPTLEMASMFADMGSPTYLYNFAYRSSTETWAPWLGVTHQLEIQWVFGMALNESRGYTREEVKFAQTIMSYWTNFAKYGNPNANCLPAWPPLTQENVYIDINSVNDFVVKTHMRAKYCKEWTKIGRKQNMNIPVK